MPDPTPLKNARQEQFAQLIAQGLTQSDAFREIHPRSRRWKPASVHEKASKLAAKVQPRVTAIQKASADGRILDLTQRNVILSDIIRLAERAIRDYAGDPFAQAKIQASIAAIRELNATTGGYEQAKHGDVPKVVFNIVFPSGPRIPPPPIKRITMEDALETQRKPLET
jgi:hypothetical protein